MLHKLPKKDERINREIKFYERFGTWAVIMSVRGEQDAAHLHVSTCNSGGQMSYSSGLEMHYASPPSYKTNTPPDHETCPFLHGKCWHDGTSMGADVAQEMVKEGDYIGAMHQLENFFYAHTTVAGAKKIDLTNQSSIL